MILYLLRATQQQSALAKIGGGHAHFRSGDAGGGQARFRSGDAAGRKGKPGAVGTIHVHDKHYSSWIVDGCSPVTPLLADAGACVCLYCNNISGTLVRRRRPDAYLGAVRTT